MSLKSSWLVAFFGILLFAYSSDAMDHKGDHDDHDQHHGEHHDGPDGPPPFEAIDADGDGTIQKAEAREFFMHQDGDEFNEAEFEEDFDRIKKNNSTKIVTTEKDYCRMSNEQKTYCEGVEVSLEIENKEDFKSLIKNYI